MRTTRDLFDLTGRVALVTGGAGHVGSAIAEALAEWGAEIHIADLKETHRLGDHILADVGKEHHIPRIVQWFRDGHDHMDILVNCAAYLDGPGLDVPIMEQTADAFDRSYAVNLRAPFLLTQACLPMLRASGHGSVINISSIYSMRGPKKRLYQGTSMGNGVAYGATKAGLDSLTRYFACEGAPEVRANSIILGGIYRGQPESFVRAYSDETITGRMGIEEDVKGAAVWLASDASAYVTGAAIPIEGGWCRW